MVNRSWKNVKTAILDKVWQKLSKPTTSLHGTAWPKNNPDLEKYGCRFDYAGAIIKDGQTFHRYQVQPNAGDKIPETFKRLRAKITTHGNIATIEIPEDGTRDDVSAALDAADDSFKL